MNSGDFVLGIGIGIFCAFIGFALFDIGMTHERRNIQDYGGFTQEWTGVKWQCAPVEVRK